MLAVVPLSLGLAACGVSESTGTESPTSEALSSFGSKPLADTGTQAPSAQGIESRLLAAAQSGELERAKTLVAAGADINAADDSGQNPYLVVTATGDVPFLRWLLDEGADPLVTDAQGGTGLIHAADAGNVGVVRILLSTDEKDRIDRVNAYGWTALLEAVLLGGGDDEHAQIVSMLLEAGADPRIADADGVTPLQHARQRGYTSIIEVFAQEAGTP